jgi:hypothetical protein
MASKARIVIQKVQFHVVPTVTGPVCLSIRHSRSLGGRLQLCASSNGLVGGSLAMTPTP